MPPAPTPTPILAARGSWRAKTRKDEPQTGPLRIAPPCPVHLQGDARRIWKHTAKRLIALGVLTALDLDALGDYAAVRAEFLALDAHVHANLDKLRDSPSYPVAVVMRNAARDAMKKLAEQFGLTPASRSRLHVEPPAAMDDPLEALLSHRG